MIRVMATRSSLPLSVIIRWLFKTNTSHIAICFDDKEVYHSNLLGVHLVSWVHFKRGAEIVECIEFYNSLEMEDEVWQAMTVREGSWYDFWGFFYFGYRGLLYRFLNRPMPIRNPFGDKKKYLCTEILSQLPNWISPSPTADLGITLPAQVMDLYRTKFGAQKVTAGIVEQEKPHA